MGMPQGGLGFSTRNLQVQNAHHARSKEFVRVPSYGCSPVTSTIPVC
jgi:hypothetical protein